MFNKFKLSSKEFRLSTINKQRTFYYRITKPVEVWGNYHTQIAFYNNQNKIIYHRQGCYAHAMVSESNLGFVKWSVSGKMALFYEFRRGPTPGDGIYDFVILQLDEQVVFRIQLNKYEHDFFNNWKDHETEDSDIMQQLIHLAITGEDVSSDSISIDPILWLTGADRWGPGGRL